MKFIRNLSQGSHDFRMTRVADENQFVGMVIIAIDFIMDFNDQGTRGINDVHVALPRFLPYLLRHAMGTENDERAVRDFMEFFNKHGPSFTQRIDDVPAVYDFMAHVNGGTISLQG